MSKIANSIYNIRTLDDFSKKATFIHKLHPLAKLISTVFYIGILISFNKYEVITLIPFVLFPVFLLVFAEIPAIPIFKRVLFIEPFIIGIGILNPIFEKASFDFFGFAISIGWLTFFSIFIKSTLIVSSTIILIATTGMDNLAKALRMLRIPKIFVLQLILTYRFIAVLAEEVYRMIRAYTLRAPGQKGIHFSSWGSFAGLLILRAYERAQRVYQSMILRAFNGEYNTGIIPKFRFSDINYVLIVCLLFSILRFCDTIF